VPLLEASILTGPAPPFSQVDGLAVADLLAILFPIVIGTRSLCPLPLPKTSGTQLSRGDRAIAVDMVDRWCAAMPAIHLRIGRPTRGVILDFAFQRGWIKGKKSRK
jgi:hypothetical protein